MKQFLAILKEGLSRFEIRKPAQRQIARSHLIISDSPD